MTDSELLDQAAIDNALRDLPAWSRDGDGIVRSYEAATFLAGLDVVQAIGRAAEEADHHPDIDIRWRRIDLRLSTHSAGGITAKDVDLAGVIDGLLG